MFFRKSGLVPNLIYYCYYYYCCNNCINLLTYVHSYRAVETNFKKPRFLRVLIVKSEFLLVYVKLCKLFELIGVVIIS